MYEIKLRNYINPMRKLDSQQQISVVKKKKKKN